MATATWSARSIRVLHAALAPTFWASLTCKIALAVLGVVVIVTPSERWQLTLLVSWCTLCSAYLVAVAVGLGIASRFPVSDHPPKLTEIARVPRLASVLVALVAVAVGIWAAVEHTLIDTTSPSGWSANLIGIWAMILAWLLLHWGFAQSYLELFYRLEPRPFRFPHDGQPGVLEFAYLSYGVAVSLAVSDVEVVTSRGRILVLAHSVLSFFFNGLIIVTALAALAEVAGIR